MGGASFRSSIYVWQRGDASIEIERKRNCRGSIHVQCEQSTCSLRRSCSLLNFPDQCEIHSESGKWEVVNGLQSGHKTSSIRTIFKKSDHSLMSSHPSEPSVTKASELGVDSNHLRAIASPNAGSIGSQTLLAKGPRMTHDWTVDWI